MSGLIFPVLRESPAPVDSGLPASVHQQAAIRDTILGHVLIVGNDHAIQLVQFGGSRQDLQAQLRENYPQVVMQVSVGFERLADRVVDRIDGSSDAPPIPLDAQGTSFQRLVWDALVETAPGATTSYAALAKQIGRPSSARAVARACASNRIAVLIPCHRVLRSDGGLGGYRWGVERKRQLLAQESGRSEFAYS